MEKEKKQREGERNERKRVAYVGWMVALMRSVRDEVIRRNILRVEIFNSTGSDFQIDNFQYLLWTEVGALLYFFLLF